MRSQKRADKKKEIEQYSRGLVPLTQGVRWQQRDHLLTAVQLNELAGKGRQKMKIGNTHEASSRWLKEFTGNNATLCGSLYNQMSRK